MSKALADRPKLKKGEPWVCHNKGAGLEEWWGLLGYTCRKDRRIGDWVLAYRGEELGRYECLSDAMEAAN